MRSLSAKSKPLAILVIVFAVFACLPTVSKGHVTATAVTIVNNSSREIRHVYLSATNQDNWGPDQLSNSVIAVGGTLTLQNVSCSGAEIKVIAEDQNGCFLYRVISCNDSVTWTITNDAVPDCGN